MKIIVERNNKKQLKICPQSDGSVIVSAYQFLSQKRIADYIAENISWIRSQHQRLSSTNISLDDTAKSNVTHTPSQTLDSSSHIVNGSDWLDNLTIKLLFSGKCLLLCGQIYRCSPSSHSQTYLQEDCLYICENQFSSRDLRLKAIKTFLKRMSANALSQQISQLGSSMALCPTKIQFKDLQGRWCSCADATARAMILDYRLIQLPQHLQSYVIAHAFVHFKYQGHTAEFFECLSTFQPKYKDCQNAIASYNFLLDI